MIIHTKLKKAILVNLSGNFKKDRLFLKKIGKLFKTLTITDLMY